MPQISDEKLISRYLKGDEQSLEVLIKRYLKPIYGLAYRFVGDSADAEDIAQEAFVRVWRNIKKFDQQKSFRPWLFAIARNTALDYLKKKKPLPFSRFENENSGNFLAETFADSASLPSQLAEDKNITSLLTAALKKLSPKYSQVFSLRHDDQLTFRQIAQALKEPLNTVKSRYRRAVITLKEILSESL
jgi:RNA polymerase sigma-70 factor (ECF subfamily)